MAIFLLHYVRTYLQEKGHFMVDLIELNVFSTFKNNPTQIIRLTDSLTCKIVKERIKLLINRRTGLPELLGRFCPTAMRNRDASPNLPMHGVMWP